MTSRIRVLRAEKKMTQKQLSELSGVSRATISNIENDTAKNTMYSTLKSIADALNTTVENLFSP